MKLKTTIRESILILSSLVLIVGVAYATTSSFSPTGTTPTNTYRTLGDIYSKLINFNLNPSATHSVSTTTNPAGSMYTLGDIYGLLTAENTRLIPNNIRNNVTIFGVRGTMAEGTGPTHTLDWTRTFPSVTTGFITETGFATGGLCWSNAQSVKASCITRVTPRYLHDTWIGGFYEANPNVGSNGENSIPLGAVQFCDYLNSNGLTVATTPQRYWRLPTKSELFMKMSDAILNPVPGPNQTISGFISGETYFTNEISDVSDPLNGYRLIPEYIGTDRVIKTVRLMYPLSINASQPPSTIPGATLGDTKNFFRCVHQN